ncbi:NAD-binding protein [Natronobeatus ordinarius]|uniref:NAD-binding protein n=1 Tax=Natronobeatus ordinarius TaxID=2963433 RepID=UPI0020CCC740|nr:NAD-binding protein [Natronobeatus ordinarius]
MLDRLRARGRRPGVHVAVWLVVAVALTSIATGIVAIVTEPALEGEGVVETVQAVAEFSGTIVGFALLVTAWGMRRGYRLAYLSAAVLVVLAGIHGVVHSRALSIPLVVLSLVGFVVLALTSPRFTRSFSFESTQVGALLAVVGVVAYGTAGAYALRAEFDGVSTVVDALYFTLVTASTVGYGDVHAVSTGARLFVISLVILGPTAVGVVVGSLVGPALQEHLSRTGQRLTADGGQSTDADQSGGSERIVVLGFDELTVPVLATLAARPSPFLVVTPDADRAAWLEAHGVAVVHGDPTDERTLEATALERATAVVVATADEAATAYGVLAVRSVDTSVPLVALAPGGRVGALERLGADVALDPWNPLGSVVVDAALGTAGTSEGTAAGGAEE